MPEKLTSRQQQEIRSQVAAFLGRTRSFHLLPKAKQEQALADTEKIVAELAQAPGNPDPYAGLARAQDVTTSGGGASGIDQTANAGMQVSGGASQMMQKSMGPEGSVINAGVDAAARMIREIDFPTFVKSLITGVFKSIVQSSIDQMKAYTDMVRSVSTSLNDFKDRNTTDNQARDSLVQRYPSLLQIVPASGGGAPTVGLRDDADTDNLPDFQKDLGLSDPITDIDDDTVEQKLVPAARDDLARGRQQLLATLVLMGINRIVITDGKINAKIQFKFSAKENRQLTASAYDYAVMGQQVSTSHSQQGSDSSSGDQPQQTYPPPGAYPGYPQGYYPAPMQYPPPNQPIAAYDESTTVQPDVRVTAEADMTQTGTISASGQIMGEVSVNFKSDVFPLEKLVDTNQLQMLASAQGAGRGTLPPAIPGAKPSGAGASSSAAPGTTPPAAGTTPPAQSPTPAPAPAH
jgi:hypothetical protein